MRQILPESSLINRRLGQASETVSGIDNSIFGLKMVSVIDSRTFKLGPGIGTSTVKIVPGIGICSLKNGVQNWHSGQHWFYKEQNWDTLKLTTWVGCFLIKSWFKMNRAPSLDVISYDNFSFLDPLLLIPHRHMYRTYLHTIKMPPSVCQMEYCCLLTLVNTCKPLL